MPGRAGNRRTGRRAAGAARAVPVALTGMAVLLPKAAGLEAYWSNLTAPVDAITEVPPGRWDPGYYPDPVYCRRGGFVDEPARVDLTGLGVMPDAVPGTDPDQLIALSVAARALEDAGGAGRLPDRDRVGVVLGRGGYLTPAQVRHDQRTRTAYQLTRTLGELLPELRPGELTRVRRAFEEQLGPGRPESAIGLVPNLAASRVANRLDLRGPAYTVDAACASSLVAVDQAIGELGSGRCDVMLAGGVHHCHDITLWSVFAQLGALSRSGRARPFDQEADGILIGEGTGVVVLKRLADARRDGDRIYAVVRGTGVAADGRAASLFSPDAEGQARAVRLAWRRAGLDPRAPGSLGLLEAHGTGTPAGDAAELAMLAEVFGSGPTGPAIGSVKSMIGHTMPAAGVAGLVKAALAVYHGVLPPTLHCDRPHPALERTRFRPLRAAEPWPGPVRRAAVNAFGFGGINAHAVLEQAPDARPAASVREPVRVLRLAADGVEDLARALEADDAALTARAVAPGAHSTVPDSTVLSDTARTGGAGRCGPRLGVVEPDARRLALARRAVASGRPWRGRGEVWFSPAPLLAPHRAGSAGAGRLAFLFPGLEAEFAPRVAEVAAHFGLPLPPGGDAAAEVTDVARHGVGVLAVGRVLDGALRRCGIVPDAVAGHSIGEWSAMLSGGLYDDATADALLDGFDPDRFQVPGVVFATLGAPAERVEAALAGRADIVLSHDNAPGQCVVCGPAAAVAELAAEFRARGVITRTLPFRSGFHTPMLAPYLEPLTAGVRRAPVRVPPLVPVWSGTTAAPFPDSAEGVRELFVRHLLEPVRFRALAESLYAAGFRAFVQVGAGALASLVGDTLHGREHLAVSAHSPRRGGIAQLYGVAIALWAEGSEAPDWRALATGSARPRETAAAPVRLDLGSGLVSLPPSARDELAGTLRAALGAAPCSGSGSGSGSRELAALAARHPAAAELDAVLAETAEAAAALFRAREGAEPEGAPARASRSAGDRGLSAQFPAPLTGRVPERPQDGTPKGRGELRDQPRTHPRTATDHEGQPLPGPPNRTTLRVGVEEMPYLLDHCFVPQRPGWPELADRRPVVPATTLLDHMVRAAERAAPGRRAVAVHELRLEQWLTALPPAEVPVAADRDGPDRLAVSCGPYARATVELSAAYGRPPVVTGAEPVEDPCELTAAQLYSDRWMFHGPAFQGVGELLGIGPRQVRGLLVAPAAPGALLDSAGQLLGYWILARRSERNVMFPVRIRGIRFFGPHPAPGTRLECRVRITSVTGTTVTADMSLTTGDGRVWAEVSGWQDRRFAVPSARCSSGYPEYRGLSEERPGGWCLLRDDWPDLASRDLVMHTHLNGPERAEYAAHPPRGRRQWLLGRIAAKDAVRQRLWARGAGPVFPAEIGIRSDGAGRPYAVGLHGRELPEYDLSLAHRAEAAVALARPRSARVHPDTGVGIDIEQVAERGDATHAVALGAGERALLAELSAAVGDGPAWWFTRFWAAKEAAAKAEGSGLRGRPRDFRVLEAAPDGLTVGTPHHTHRVRCAAVATSAPRAPSRNYVVAWTAAPDPTEESEA
ncbi:type I polyketide synthase [Streptomyces boncukensis]|uniref:Acyltransferase domain-containing protein n=1 Tax=Streptomyces boncukensis TaxID=2711219 RepID=A0A6G4WSV0_9ACTN|nr:type I polyketide synthase [Streptomyces boncukensis]NGO67720.1 acyltransferase domain-containing protein [Streptomyces boncukensis]